MSVASIAFLFSMAFFTGTFSGMISERNSNSSCRLTARAFFFFFFLVWFVSKQGEHEHVTTVVVLNVLVFSRGGLLVRLVHEVLEKQLLKLES